MEKNEFLALQAKYLDGTLTQEEQLRFLDACVSMEDTYSEWRADLMGDKEVVKKRLFAGVVADIQDAETSVTPVRPLFFNWRFAVAAAVLAGAFFVAGTFKIQLLNKFFPVKILEARAEKGKLLQKELPDGTMVWLNSGSSMSFPEEFRDSVRSISLSGEAYFSVAHDQTKPFIIKTQNLETRVLGTRFVIKSYPNDKLSMISVLQGKVAVREDAGGSASGVILTAMQQVTADRKSGMMEVKKAVDSTSMMAWTSGKLIYRHTPLALVIEDLERKYEIEITAAPHLLTCKIFADIMPSDAVKDVLEQLAVSLEGKVSLVSGSNYKITGKGCKQPRPL